MEYRQRKFIAAVVLAISLAILAYLLFFTPSETPFTTPVATSEDSSGAIASPTTAVVALDRKLVAGTAAPAKDDASGSGTTNDTEAGRALLAMPDWMDHIVPVPEHSTCPGGDAQAVQVANADALVDALAAVQPGATIVLEPGIYAGNFALAASGDATHPIWLCGPRSAVVDSGGPKNGYGLHITGSHVGVWGLTVSNAQKGIMVDGGDFVQIDSVEVHTIGDEAIHFRGHATDGVVQDSLVHHTGLRRDKFGEGIYIGSAVSNWSKITGGEPDKSDRVVILRNRIWDTTAESVDLKEGTSDGRVESNAFDGGSLSGADSWVDVKGNGYSLIGNTGKNSTEDGFQTHNIDDLGWGTHNTFVENTAHVSGPGFGFYIHDAEKTDNVVSCTNIVEGAAAGFANVSCSDTA